MRRLIVAGTHSGCGKTTVALALMRALIARGHAVAPFKVGPDYIDPGFHQIVCGRASHNLDEQLMDGAAINLLLNEGMRGADIAVIEGVMGYYDGVGGGFSGSTHTMAKLTSTPVLLVVDAAGSATSAAATALGFERMAQPSGITAVIVNRASSERHYALVRDAIAHYTGLPCVGWMRKDASLTLKSRHLGLIPAAEVRSLSEQVDLAASLLSLDWEMLRTLTDGLTTPTRPAFPVVKDMRGFRLGIARDEAFSFYYEANLMLLRQANVELVPFSPLRDKRLPEGLNGLYIGGGFPEVFAGELSENAPMRTAIRAALTGGMRCYAECGGLMYLCESIDGHEMVGFYPGQCAMTDRLQRFGYVEVEDESGFRAPAHEFHHSVCEMDEGVPRSFKVRSLSNPDKQWRCGYLKQRTLAGYPHLHFLSRPAIIERLWGESQ